MVSEQAYYTGQSIIMDSRSKVVDEHLKKLDLEVVDLGTVTSRLEAKLESTNQNLQVFVHRQEKLEGVMLDLNQKSDKLVAMIAQLSVDLKMDQKNKRVEEYVVTVKPGLMISTLGASNIGTRGEYKGNTTHPNIDFPQFVGERPKEWLRKAREYFQIHQTPNELRLGVAKKYLEGKAYVWFYGYIASHPRADWEVFSDELCKRFVETNGEEVDEDEENEPQVDKEHMSENELGGEEIMEVSINALAGGWKHKTIRVLGMIKGKKISILMDSRTTHSFVDEKLAEELRYVTDENSKVTVKVANRDKLESKALSQPVVWKMQSWEFQFKLRTLKLVGSDLVLGVNWMSQFGPINFDFTQGCIQFRSNCGVIELKSEASKDSVKIMGVEGMERMLGEESYGKVEQLYNIREEKSGEVPNKILEVIYKFFRVFEGLPPPRPQGHKIPLKEGTQPFKLRPYRCPFIQKSEIEKLVKGMPVEGGANNVNHAYATLHYLLNPRVVKRMRQLLTVYKENILTLNLEDKVNLRGRNVMG